MFVNTSLTSAVFLIAVKIIDTYILRFHMFGA